MQNRVDSDWMPFTVASTLSAHAYKPAIDLDGFGAASWSWDEGRTGFVGWFKVIDHDGVSSDGQSHTATVEYPDGREGNMYFVRPASATAGYYEYWSADLPPSGNYTFKVIDPDGNETASNQLYTGWLYLYRNKEGF